MTLRKSSSVIIIALLATMNIAVALTRDDRVQANATIKVRTPPPTLAETGSTQPAGALGTIVAGPTQGTAGGFTGNWYSVNWDSGTDGWSAEPYLTKIGTIAPAPSISRIDPNPATVDPNNNPKTLSIIGANFVNKPVVILTWTGQSGYTVPTSQVTFVGPTKIDISVRLGTNADNWTAKVINPDGKPSNTVGFQVVLPQGSGTIRLTVNANGGSSLLAAEMNAALLFQNTGGPSIARKQPVTANPMDFTGISYGSYYFLVFCWDMLAAESGTFTHSSSTTFRSAVANAKRPLNISVYYNDNITPVPDIGVIVQSYNGENGSWTTRVLDTTDNEGRYSINVWPTTQSASGEKYRIHIETPSNLRIGSNEAVIVPNTTTGANVRITTSLSPPLGQGDLGVTLKKVDGTNAPVVTNSTPRFVLYTNPPGQIPGFNPATFKNVTAGTYWVEAFHTGTFWGEEFWNSEQKQVLPNQSNSLVLTRKYPYVTQNGVAIRDARTNDLIPFGSTVPAGSSVIFSVRVQNDVPSAALNTQIQFVLDYSRDGANDYDSGLTAAKLISSSGGVAVFETPAITLNANGSGPLYCALRVVTTTTSGPHLTDSWGWTLACNVMLSSRTVDAIKGINRSAVVLARYGDGDIVAASRTWIIIHGRDDTVLGAKGEWARKIGDAIHADEGTKNDQILLLDWSEAAKSSQWVFDSEDWIEPVAIAASDLLRDLGFQGDNVYLIGHSWGAYVSAEIGERIPLRDGSSLKRVHSLVALDPARDYVLGAYNPEASVNFTASALRSWAFRSSYLGSSYTPSTADEAIAVSTSTLDSINAHSSIKAIFTDLLERPNNGVSQHFRLSRLISGTLDPWRTNQYYHQLLPIELVHYYYEAHLYSTVDSQRPHQLNYISANTGAQVTEYATTDTTPMYTVAGIAGANGVISPETPQSVRAGGNASFAATPNNGYVVDRWLVNTTLVQIGGNSFTLNNITTSSTVQVSFKPAPVNTYSVTPSAGANGSINPSTVQTTTSGSSMSFTATPNNGYMVDQWLVNNGLAQAGGTFYALTNITSNKTVHVTFRAVVSPTPTPSPPTATPTPPPPTPTPATPTPTPQPPTPTPSSTPNPVGPTVQTLAASSVTSTSAVINGTVISSGGAVVDDYYFSYWSDPNSPIGIEKSGITVSGNNFSAILTRLVPNTTYYFRAYARNSSTADIGWGVGWGRGATGSVRTAPFTKPDFNGDNIADIVWQNDSTGEHVIWTMTGPTHVADAWLPTFSTDWEMAGAGDFNGDGQSDILWQNNVTGQHVIWLMNGTSHVADAWLDTFSTDWKIAGTGDFNADSQTDILWQNIITGQRVIWLMNGTSRVTDVWLPTFTADWKIAGTGDFNGNGQTDILWQNTATGEHVIWLMNGTNHVADAWLPTFSTDWKIAGAGDFSGDGQPDILWQNTATGQHVIWMMNGTMRVTDLWLDTFTVDWQIAGAGEFTGDGQTDILWQNKVSGEHVIWEMKVTAHGADAWLPTFTVDWQIGGAGDFNGDGQTDMLWQNKATGEHVIWLMNGTTHVADAWLPTFTVDWQIAGAADFNGDGQTDILWQNKATGEHVIWLMNGTTHVADAWLPTFSVDWQIAGAGDFDDDDKPDILWQNKVTGQHVIWIMDGPTRVADAWLPTFSVDWQIGGAGDFNRDGQTDILWQNAITGQHVIWVMKGTARVTDVWLPTFSTDWKIRNR